MKKLLSLLLLLSWAVPAQAELQTKLVTYKDGKTKLQGYIAYDDSFKGPRPGVLVAHEWWGFGDYVKGRAEQLARLGYVAFALDMYGQGVFAEDHKKAGELSGLYRRDRKLMRRRAQAGLKILTDHKLTDKARVAAIGYCFGGSTVLELGRAGADLKGIVTFHGGLGTPTPEDARNIKGKVLVLHGADDPMMGGKQVGAFQKEMKEAGVDWQMIFYGGAVHSFTVPTAGNDPSKGAAYNADADRRSWQAMTNLFDEIFN